MNSGKREEEAVALFRRWLEKAANSTTRKLTDGIHRRELARKAKTAQRQQQAAAGVEEL